MAFVFLLLGVFAVCGLVTFLSWVWLLALGFKKHWGWGCALLAPTVLFIAYLCTPTSAQGGILTALAYVVLISPIVFVAFIIVDWTEAQYPFFWIIGSACVSAAAFYGTLFYAVETSQQMLALLHSRGVSTGALERASAWHPLPPPPPPPSSPVPARETPSTAGAPATPAVFHSRLPARLLPSGQREPARPGIYYLLEFVSNRNPRGVKNGLPGEQVTLLQRLPNGKLLVTVGNADFEVDASQLTDDIEVARDVEKRYFDAHKGQL